MFTKRILSFTLISSTIAAVTSSCTHNQFSAFNLPDVNSQPKTPGYYNPNDRPMLQNQQPVIENQFYWKNTHDNSATMPGEE